MKKVIFWIYAVIFSVSCAGGVLNGSFEFFDPAHSEAFIPPVDWEYENYAGIHRDFVAESSVTWSVPPAVDGSYFCLLSTGQFGMTEDRYITFSKMSQPISLEPGDYLIGTYFFGTCDWTPYNDDASISLVAVDPNKEPNFVELAYVTVMDVGNYRAMEGWEEFTYSYTGTQRNEYYLVCEIRDILDTIIPSYLAVDDFKICKVSGREGDLNGDCMVNLVDFTLFSTVWMSVCNEPNAIPDEPNDISEPNDLYNFNEFYLFGEIYDANSIYDPNVYDPNSVYDPNVIDPNTTPDPDLPSDPNVPCELADLDGLNGVDLGDLEIMSSWWLTVSP